MTAPHSTDAAGESAAFANALGEAAAVARRHRAERDLARALESGAAGLERGMDGIASAVRVMREAACPEPPKDAP